MTAPLENRRDDNQPPDPPPEPAAPPASDPEPAYEPLELEPFQGSDDPPEIQT